jgi:hypothetical protein
MFSRLASWLVTLGHLPDVTSFVSEAALKPIVTVDLAGDVADDAARIGS